MALLGDRQGILWKWYSDFIDGLSANVAVRKLEAVPEFLTHNLQHLDRFGNNFAADAIASQDCDFCLHTPSSFHRLHISPEQTLHVRRWSLQYPFVFYFPSRIDDTEKLDV